MSTRRSSDKKYCEEKMNALIFFIIVGDIFRRKENILILALTPSNKSFVIGGNCTKRFHCVISIHTYNAL
jgi:hypothetical protein